MAKHTTKEAFFERLKTLAEVNVPQGKKSESRNLGSLIDYKRAADGVAYGIIKEQHHYYIKKGGLKQDPDVADFAYIGGLGNITNFQYPSLAVADKHRSIMLHTINEAVSSKPNINGSKKKKLNEDKAGKEIDNAESKLSDLDAATDAEATPEMPVDTEVPIEANPEGDAEASAEVPAPEGGEEIPAEEPAPEGGEEVPAPEGGEEVPAENPEGENPEGENPESSELAPEDEKSLTVKEIEKNLGKITQKIRSTELTDSQDKSYIKSFLQSFKGKIDDIDIDDRKELADLILKVVPDKDIEDVAASVPQDSEEETGIAAEGQCAECGGFGSYAESRGYDNPESFMECDDEEKASVLSGYANAHGEGQNDGDFKMVALLVTPEIIEKLKGDYGHDEYAEKLTPYTNELSEASEEDKLAQINELWGGLGKAFKKVGGDIGSGIKKGAQAVGGAVQKGAQAVGGAVQKGAQAVGQYAKGVQQAYHTGEVPGEIKKLEGLAADLGKQVAALNTRLTKAGQQPVNVNSILQSITNQLGHSNTASLGQYGVAAEGVVDPGNVEVQPPLTEIKVPEKKGKKLSATGVKVGVIKEEDDPEEEEEETPETDVIEPETEETPEPEVSEPEVSKPEPKFNFAPMGQSLGGGVVKPEGAPTTGVDITVQPDKTINIAMNEAKKKLIKSIAEGVNVYMNEITPVKKLQPVKNLPPVMSENEKKLRKYIRERLEVKAGLRKERLTESKKSSTLKKLDTMIDEQFKLYESVVLKKKVNEGAKPVNEIFGLSVKEKFAKLDPNDQTGVSELFTTAFHDILTNPLMSRVGTVAYRASTPEKYNLIKQYIEGNGGTLRIDKAGKPVYMSKHFQSTGTRSPEGGGSTGLTGI